MVVGLLDGWPKNRKDLVGKEMPHKDLKEYALDLMKREAKLLADCFKEALTEVEIYFNPAKNGVQVTVKVVRINHDTGQAVIALPSGKHVVCNPLNLVW